MIDKLGESLQQLKGLPPGIRHVHLEQVDSTNTYALNQGMPGNLITADSQTGGRGRLGRQWFSPPGENLYFSLVLVPQVPQASWGSLSLAVGVATARILAHLGFVPALKWPNDVLLEGRKVAGILLEARGAEKLVMGVGINVNQTSFPPDLQDKATSMALVSGSPWSRSILLTAIIPEIMALVHEWTTDRQGVLEKWRAMDCLQGRVVELRRGSDIFQGIAQGIDARGQLILQDQAGNIHMFASGEATLNKSP